mgnify:CR=1 FL=1
MNKKNQFEHVNFNLCTKFIEPSWKESCYNSSGFSNFNSSGFATFNSNVAINEPILQLNEFITKDKYKYKDKYKAQTKMGYGYDQPIIEKSWSKYFKSILQPKIQIVKNKSTQLVLTAYNCLSVLNSTFEYLTVNIWYDLYLNIYLYNDNHNQFNKIKYEIKNQIKNEMESGLLFKIQQTQELRMSINKIDLFTKEHIKYLNSNIIQLNRENHKLKYKIVLENILSYNFKNLKNSTIDDYEKI